MRKTQSWYFESENSVLYEEYFHNLRDSYKHNLCNSSLSGTEYNLYFSSSNINVGKGEGTHLMLIVIKITSTQMGMEYKAMDTVEKYEHC